ncbi:6-pyruvoyl trahydropterin synthase family protein [Enhygromyxa salina]|uniref:6-carboxy-5,6,7,8-tetrahydropterin synthase n=1 Tax=Enhygromyxa salina TaxID=215803 RepID=A0A2S9XL02_9BACT|nr:6-carboxytetrahydropterin synthase [Enhygromyxa salina]PRP93533.1 6-pyruvoyl tetrahydropterin synthase [Enhygromyxa salina]
MRYRSTKTFTNLPCAHRLHSHPGHCRFVHGYSRSFKFYFEASELDEHNFVVDFAALKDVRQWLEHMYDHTLLIGEHDPELAFFREMEARKLCDLRVVPSVTMEGTAALVFEHVDALIRDKTNGRAWVAKVEVHENDKNSAELERIDDRAQ